MATPIPQINQSQLEDSKIIESTLLTLDDDDLDDDETSNPPIDPPSILKMNIATQFNQKIEEVKFSMID